MLLLLLYIFFFALGSLIGEIVLFLFLLYMIFHEKNLIPITIKVRKLIPKEKAEKTLDPKIPHSEEIADSQGDDVLEALHIFIDW